MRVGDQVLGRFRVDDLIRVCGQSIVGVGVDLANGAKVAIKKLNIHQTDQNYDRQLARFRAASSVHISHDHVVNPIECGTGDESSITIFPLIEGADLAKVAGAKGLPLPIDQAVSVIAQIGSALQAVHDRGIVHRDVKPENIMIDRAGRAHLIDFGIAKIPGHTGATLAGTLLGSPQFMSPEQFESPSAVDARADQYALALVLYLLVSGQQGRDGSTPDEIRLQASLPPRPLSTFATGIPDDLDRACLKALSPDPRDRFETVREFVSALTAGSGPDVRCLACGGRTTDCDSCDACSRPFAAPPPSIRIAGGDIFLIPNGTFTTGRGQLAPGDRRMSRRQCRVSCNGAVLIEDLGGANPTQINGSIPTGHELKNGDELVLARLKTIVHLPGDTGT